jgi:hypothetical protein
VNQRIHSGTEGIKGNFAVAPVHGYTETAHIKLTKKELMADAVREREREKSSERELRKKRAPLE